MCFLLRAFRAPFLDLFRDHMPRLVAGHGPTDEHENASDLEAQAREGDRLNHTFCAPLHGAPARSLGEASRGTAGMSDAEYAALLRSAGPGEALEPPDAFNEYVRRVHAALARNRAQLQR